MPNGTTTISTKDRLEAQAFVEVYRAYTEASDDVQGVVNSMIQIINDPESDADECGAALDTVIESLWPCRHKGELGIDIEELRNVEMPEEVEGEFKKSDADDAVFADRLKRLMQDKGMNQSELAKRVGVGQPAISMMLARKCHPQRCTVEKLASALEVEPDQLWPEFSADSEPDQRA